MRRLLTVALATLAGCARSPEATPLPQTRPLVRWTASSGRLDWLPSDTVADAKGFTPQLVRDLPRDYTQGPRVVSMALPPLPVPKSAEGCAITAAYVINERGDIERITFVALDDRAYTRALMTELRRAMFRPAVRADGTPTRGYYLLTLELPRYAR